MQIKSLAVAFCVLFLCSACIPAINENISSKPPLADIYWGKTKNNLEKTHHETPFYRTINVSTLESWCYQAKRNGYLDSDIICKEEASGDRNIHFNLTPIPTPKNQLSVSATGAASALSKITTSETAECRPALSPDGKWLLLEVSENGRHIKACEYNIFKNTVLQKLNLGNSSKIILTSKIHDSREGSWLPDDSAIVYSTSKMKDYTIVQSLGVSGATAVRFISPNALGPARWPSVSPTGKEVAFSVFHSSLNNQICIIGIVGNDLRVYGPGWNPSWSPNGKQLSFTRKVGDYTHIYTMDIATGANLMELTSIDANDFSATWSPDGKHIAFISDRVGGRDHLFVMDDSGRGVTQLTDGLFDLSSANWGKDGFIYFSANAGENWDIWRLKPKFN